MTTLADDLLADLLDSGSDNESEDDYGVPSTAAKDGDPVEDGDEEEDNGEDEEEAYRQANASKKRAAPADEDEARARVEKMDFAGINDIRSVAPLMKTLQPVMEVSTHSPLLPA
jgi:U4/U6 small nuclear ribonucleoprotein PRP31